MSKGKIVGAGITCHEAVEERRAYFAPLKKHCPQCEARLYVRKTVLGRQVITLGGIVGLDEAQLYCPSPECPGAQQDKQTGKGRPLVFKSKELLRVVLP